MPQDANTGTKREETQRERKSDAIWICLEMEQKDKVYSHYLIFEDIFGYFVGGLINNSYKVQQPSFWMGMQNNASRGKYVLYKQYNRRTKAKPVESGRRMFY